MPRWLPASSPPFGLRPGRDYTRASLIDARHSDSLVGPAPRRTVSPWVPIRASGDLGCPGGVVRVNIRAMGKGGRTPDPSSAAKCTQGRSLDVNRWASSEHARQIDAAVTTISERESGAVPGRLVDVAATCPHTRATI
jgi:hypothetical protein